MLRGKLATVAWYLAAGFLAIALTSQSAFSEETLRVPYLVDIASFDPDNGFEIGSMSAINNVYEGLVQYKPETVEIVGRLAKAWEISDDGRRYVFHLVDGVRFHDGSTLSAADVAMSFKRRRDGGLALSYFLENVDNIEAVDGLTLKIDLKRPQPSFLDSLASPWGPKVISSKALSEHDIGDKAAGWLNEHANGTGPYVLTEFQRGDRYVLKRNEFYWGRKPFFSEVQLPVIPDISQQLLQLQAGDIDLVPTGYPFSQLRGIPTSFRIFSAPSVTLYTLFTKAGSPLDDPEIREAVLTAINPNDWATDAFGEYAAVAKSIYPRVVLNPERAIVFPTDVERAKEIIARRGPSTLTIALHSASPAYQRVAGLLIAQLASIGVEATAYPLPQGAAFNLKNAASKPDFLLTIAGPDAAHPENQAKAFYTEEAPLNFFGRSTEAADHLFEEAGRAIDIQNRNKLYEKAGQIIFEAGIAIPLVEVNDVVVHVEGLQDLGLRPVYPPGNIDFGSIHR
ncbi:ABC transporter substrate-binding protein [Endobacterium cereale]|uniref:ABC transporter substrate-binding protein n=1 Tax=Endobacterium cereale TaxID=2663029 RepID=UPI002B47558C|nr:ABC transporter substrate-binding protein [Endobacterium cereale]MEB2848062.1 ABC transporter substrate-binding protein [Endobacterium cereale]